MTQQTYLRSQPPTAVPQVLSVLHEGRLFNPVILHAGEETFTPTLRQSHNIAHAHQVYHLVLYTAGCNQFSYRGTLHDSRPGTFVIASPGEAHHFPPLEPGDPVTYLEITLEYVCGEARLTTPFNEVFARHIGLPVTAGTAPVHLDDSRQAALTAQMRRLPELMHEDPALTDFLTAAALVEVLATLARLVYRPATSAAVESPVSIARRELDRRYREPLRLPALATLAGCSPGYLCRAFKQAVGLTPIAYQQELRINAARTLLTTTSLSCKEIAMRTGFADEYYFFRMFKRLTGRTPRQYRQSMR